MSTSRAILSKTLKPLLQFIGAGVLALNAHAHQDTDGEKHWYLPENSLHLKSPGLQNNMTEGQFRDIINDVATLYCPIIQSYGAGCDISGDWESTIVNAYAMRYGGDWIIALYGGLARRRELSADGFAAVACHEVGHHIAGFAFKSFVLGDNWASTEGQSDYFAAHACLPELWRDDTAINASFRSKVNPIAKEKCDRAWDSPARQNLCYRVASAAESVTLMIARTSNRYADPKLSTPSDLVVEDTNEGHPVPQCRLDTQMAAALCPIAFDFTRIPGDGLGESNRSLRAELDSTSSSCHSSRGFIEGSRPRCWFAPKLTASP